MKLVIYRNVEQMFVMTEAQEDEFVGRYFGGDSPPDDEWDRFESENPIEIERPEVSDFSDVYDSYEV